MKKIVLIGLFFLAGLIFAACSLLGVSLKPGDKIGEMVVSNNLEIGMKNFNDLCTFEQLLDSVCEIPISNTKFGVSTGWGEATLEELEKAWKDSTWEVRINGRKVAIEEFGTFDMDLGDMQVRVWNIAITNPPLGKHTVEYKFRLYGGSRPGNHTQTYTFTVVP
jgi:hypothetical protein